MNKTKYTYLGNLLFLKKCYKNWSLNQERRYIYGSNLLVQERDQYNNVVNEIHLGPGPAGGHRRGCRI